MYITNFDIWSLKSSYVPENATEGPFYANNWIILLGNTSLMNKSSYLCMFFPLQQMLLGLLLLFCLFLTVVVAPVTRFIRWYSEETTYLVRRSRAIKEELLAILSTFRLKQALHQGPPVPWTTSLYNFIEIICLLTRPFISFAPSAPRN